MLYRHTRRVSAAVILAFTFLSGSFTAIAQTFRGGINGTVTDQSGAVVPGAIIEAVESATGVSHKTISSSAGAYAFQDLPLGTYTVKVIASGFKDAQVTGIPVTAGVIYTLPVKLSVQSTGETVEVSASALALDTTTATQTTGTSSGIVRTGDITVS